MLRNNQLNLRAAISLVFAIVVLVPLFLIVHDLSNIENQLWQEKLAKEFPLLSHTLIRRWLVSVNEQQLYRLHSSAAEAATQALFRFVDPVKSKRDSDLFFRPQSL